MDILDLYNSCFEYSSQLDIVGWGQVDNQYANIPSHEFLLVNPRLESYSKNSITCAI